MTWRKKWWLEWDETHIFLYTPLFGVQLLAGHLNLLINAIEHSVVFFWRPDWTAAEGVIIFQREWYFLLHRQYIVGKKSRSCQQHSNGQAKRPA